VHGTADLTEAEEKSAFLLNRQMCSWTSTLFFFFLIFLTELIMLAE